MGAGLCGTFHGMGTPMESPTGHGSPSAPWAPPWPMGLSMGESTPPPSGTFHGRGRPLGWKTCMATLCIPHWPSLALRKTITYTDTYGVVSCGLSRIETFESFHIIYSPLARKCMKIIVLTRARSGTFHGGVNPLARPPKWDFPWGVDPSSPPPARQRVSSKMGLSIRGSTPIDPPAPRPWGADWDLSPIRPWGGQTRPHPTTPALLLLLLLHNSPVSVLARMGSGLQQQVLG